MHDIEKKNVKCHLLKGRYCPLAPPHSELRGRYQPHYAAHSLSVRPEGGYEWASCVYVRHELFWYPSLLFTPCIMHMCREVLYKSSDRPCHVYIMTVCLSGSVRRCEVN